MDNYDDAEFALNCAADDHESGFPPDEGIKHDGDKIRMDLLPFEALEAVAAVLMYGAEKYAPDNWQKVRHAESRYTAALLRHMVAAQRGEKFDAESGLSHAAHMATNALFILWFEIQKGKENGRHS